ncbi:efflux RND transporter permease subunit [Spongiibacter sp.]|uniref:efflux RND transporter permease subunit n=1 Tax=Spongiibacter sp. TaxID=2024860 RepID=UPI00356382E6
MKSLVGFFVRRPLLVNLMLVMIFLGGYVVTKSQVYSSYPSIDTGFFVVTTVRPGASAEDVELSVTVPLEEEILKIDGIDSLRSASMEGLSSLTIQSDPDNDRAENREFRDELQKAIDKAFGRMPEDVPEKPDLLAEDPDRTPVMEILIHGNVAEDILRQTARRLQTAVRRVPGVAGTERKGYRRKEVKILLDPLKLQHLGMNYDEVINAIKGHNVRDSGGSLESFTSERDVVTVGQFRDPHEVEEVIVRVAGRDNFVRIKDIAEVVVDFEDWLEQSMANGEPGISLRVKKSANANGLKVSKELLNFIDQQKELLPPGVELTPFNDTTRYARNMLDVLFSNAMVGMALVFFSLLAFFPLRFSIWVVAGIPTAILMSFMMMPAMGITMNQLSISGLILMLGVLVDDGIVVSEGIFQESERGKSPIDAAIDGTSVIAAPVLTSSATTLLAFMPLIFLSGIEGKFLWMLPAVVVMVLLASLIECLFILPAHMRHALEHAQAKGQNTLSRQWFVPIERGYSWLMHKMFSHRVLSFIGIALLAVIAAVYSANRLVFDLYPDSDTDQILVKLELPLGASFSHTREHVLALERKLIAVLDPRDLLATKATIGNHDVDNEPSITEGRQSYWGKIDVYLHPQSQRAHSSNEVISVMRELFKAQPDFSSIQIHPFENSPPTGEAVELDIVGNDPSRFLVADQLLHILESHPHVDQAWSSYKSGKDIVDLVLKPELLANYGLSVADVTRAVRIAFDGLLIDEMQTVEERIKFRLQYRKPEQGQLETLYGLSVINKRGQPVLLHNIANLETRPNEATIYHYFGDRTVTVYASIDKEKISVAQINNYVADYIAEQRLAEKFPELRIIEGGEADRQQSALGNIADAALLSIAGIALLLVLLFNSVTQPLLVMMVIPLGVIGTLFVFALQGAELSLSALTGFTGLAGILVNDSLIMIDQLNRARSGGILDREALVRTAQTRLRPIFLTTVTTALGLYPVAYGTFGTSPTIAPIAMVMLWGVILGSIITLFYLPSLYAIEQDLRRLLSRRRKSSRAPVV